MRNRDGSNSRSPGGERFATTHWSVVLAAGGRHAEADWRQAMEALCRTYWYPIYAYVRRCGHGAADAQDLTQAFFAHVLRSKLVEKARREKGRFRSFLLTAAKNFVASEYERARAMKRGGKYAHFSLDDAMAEGRYAAEPRDEKDPARLYEKAWATAVLEQALGLLEANYVASDKRLIFDRLLSFLCGEPRDAAYAAVAGELGTSESAVKMMVQRLRRRYRECVRAVVGSTVGTCSEVDEELRHLVQVLRS